MVPNYEIIIPLFGEVPEEIMACHILNSKLNTLACLIKYSMLVPHLPDNHLIS